MTRLKKSALAMGVIGCSMLMASGAAQAYVMASAMVEWENFQILGSDGEILDAGTGGDFAGLTFTSSADQSVSLTGAGGGTDSDSASTSSSATLIDFDPICVGNGCNPITPNNDLPKLSAPPDTGNYAAADQYEAGAPVANLQTYSDPAFVGNGAYVGIDTGSADGSGNSNNNLNSSFVFTLTNDQLLGITFDFDINAWLQVAVTGDEIFPGFATASYQLEITLTDQLSGATIGTFAPDLFGDGTKTLSINAPTALGLDLEYTRDATGEAFAWTTAALTGGTPYQLSIRSQVNADASRVSVPAPGLLALMGIGLLGIGATRRGGKSAAA